jgi:hypothetical protein
MLQKTNAAAASHKNGWIEYKTTTATIEERTTTTIGPYE